MRILCYLIGELLSFVLPVSLHDALIGCKKYIRTGYYSRKLKAKGVGFSFSSDSCIIGPEYITMGDRVEVGKRTVISAWHRESDAPNPSLVLEEGVIIGDDCHITASNSIVIKEHVLLGKKVTITDNAHGNINLDSMLVNPSRRPLVSKGPVVIGSRVWIGDKATVLPGVTIGEGSIIGANAVVTKDVPAFSVAVGIPAVVVKSLKEQN